MSHRPDVGAFSAQGGGGITLSSNRRTRCTLIRSIAICFLCQTSPDLPPAPLFFSSTDLSTCPIHTNHLLSERHPTSPPPCLRSPALCCPSREVLIPIVLPLAVPPPPVSLSSGTSASANAAAAPLSMVLPLPPTSLPSSRGDERPSSSQVDHGQPNLSAQHSMTPQKRKRKKHGRGA
jgi:hypothetical protein